MNKVWGKNDEQQHSQMDSAKGARAEGRDQAHVLALAGLPLVLFGGGSRDWQKPRRFREPPPVADRMHSHGFGLAEHTRNVGSTIAAPTPRWG